MSEQDNLQPVDGNEEQKPIVPTTEETPQTEPTSAPEVDVKNEDVVFEEIEASNAEDAEDEGNNERHTIPFKEYDTMSLEALVIELEKLVSEEKVQAIKEHVDGIKNEFNSKFNTLIDEKKEDFLNEGGNEIDFYYSSPVQKRFKDAYKDYKGQLHSHYKKIETNLKGNLENRLRIIEDIKSLIGVEENINTTYKHFKDLQEEWRTAGPIPRDKYNNAWNSYHHHVEIFYDFLHLNRDLRDLDFKHNLDLKLKIIDRAEELAQDEDTNRSFRELQVLHKMWKEELGPVSKEHREEIWNRFKAATKIIHNKRQAYYDELDKVYEVNLEKKTLIIDKIESLTNEGAKSHNGWQAKIKEIEQLRELFFSAGKVPLKVNESTWAKFKEAVRSFNRKKNVFYKDLKKEQFDNLQKKLDLIKIAEEHKDSEDTEATTPLMKRIQNDWKKIGHVPRKDSDKIWKQFKAACNAYFDKMHSKKNAENEVEVAAFKAKSELLDRLKTLEFTADKEEDLELIKTQISSWKAIGRVPSNKRFIEGKFNKALDELFKQVKVSKNEAELIKFENKLDELSNANDSRHLDNERLFIRKKIDEVKAEINQLENNLQFFTNVKNDNPLVKEVYANIERHKDALKLWKTKLSKIKALY